jgi:hypothetical protein
MKLLSLFLLTICFISCSEDREITNTIYLDVVASDPKLAQKISKLILDDMSRYECVMPKDWNIKLATKPCSKITKFDLSQRSKIKSSDVINQISILSGKKFVITHKRFNGNGFTSSYSSKILSLGSDEEPNAVNFAKSVITKPLYMIGFK